MSKYLLEKVKQITAARYQFLFVYYHTVTAVAYRKCILVLQTFFVCFLQYNFYALFFYLFKEFYLTQITS